MGTSAKNATSRLPSGIELATSGSPHQHSTVWATEADKETDRQADKETDRQTKKQTDRQTKKQKDRQTTVVNSLVIRQTDTV